MYDTKLDDEGIGYSFAENKEIMAKNSKENHFETADSIQSPNGKRNKIPKPKVYEKSLANKNDNKNSNDARDSKIENHFSDMVN